MIVVTGAAGFIGSALLAKLNAEGINDIIVVDDLGKSTKWRNLVGKRFADYLHKQLFLEVLQENGLPADVEAVVHLGACSSTTEEDMDYLVDNNLSYTKLLAEACVERGVRFIYASSAATYGDGSLGYSDDEELLHALRPLNRYGFSKQLFDLWAHNQGILRSVAGLKFFNVFGPNEYHKEEMLSVAYKAFQQISERGVVSLFRSYRKEYADGEQRRDFIYVKDCCEVIWWLLQNSKVTGLFNLGSGTARSWNDLARAVFAALDRSPSIEYIDMPEILRDQYQYLTEAPMAKLRSAGYTKEFLSLEHGVRDYVLQHLVQGQERIL